MAVYFSDAAGGGSIRVLTRGALARATLLLALGALARATLLLADERREPDQPDPNPASPDDGHATGTPFDPFADYYRMEADPDDPCLD